MFKNERECFTYKEVRINYRLTSKKEMEFSPFFAFEFDSIKDDEPIIYIEWIENHSSERGKGEGTTALLKFTRKMDARPDISHIVLQSNFHEDNHNEYYGLELTRDERISAISRLVRFYEKAGFKGDWSGEYQGKDHLDCPNMKYKITGEASKIDSTLEQEADNPVSYRNCL